MNTLLRCCSLFFFFYSTCVYGESERVPEIRIHYGYFLDKMSCDAPLSENEITERMNANINAWHPYEQEVLVRMQRIIGLTFRQNVIDVYLTSRSDETFSDPLVVSLKNSGKNGRGFLREMSHELVHRLVTDNSERVNGAQVLDEMFPEETSRVTKNHVIVFALLTYLYSEEIPEPKLLEHERDVGDPEYVKAWQIVDAIGYKNIIEEFRRHYK